MTQEKIEIPFGACDSELKGWEYTIPEGMEAVIENGRVIVRQRESEDERIRKHLIDVVEMYWGKTNAPDKAKDLAYLEKQKAKEQYNRMTPIYENKEAFESALDKAWKFYNDSGASTVDGLEDSAFELCFAKGFREGFLYGEKQKEPKTTVEKLRAISTPAEENWLENQKKWKEEDSLTKDEREFLTDEITAFLCNYDREFDGDDPVPSDVAEHFYLLGKKAQQPAEWSEEDETYLQDALLCIEQAEKVAKDKGDMGACWSARRWLKSLRPHWKPSDEQMEALQVFLEHGCAAPDREALLAEKHLESLYNDLQKLL